MELIPQLIILISALFLLLIPLAFIFVAFFSATIKKKRTVQIVATVMLALATVGVGLIWFMLLVVGGFQQLEYDMKRGQAELDFPMVVYYSPWYVIGLWIVNIGVFLIDMFGKNDRDKKRIGRLLFGVVTVAVITTAAVIMIGGGNPQPSTPSTPSIHEAAGATGRKGNIEDVKQHLAAGTDVDARDKQDKTPLQHAAFWNHKEIAELLIAEGADVNAKDYTGNTTLHWAVIGRKNKMVELLILNGANVNAKTWRGFTPLDEAIKYKRTETAALLRKHGAKSGAEDSIHIAARTGNHEAVKQHLAAGTDVNAKERLFGTPLHHAAMGGHKEIAELLIANGADVNAKDDRGRTPLHWAAYDGRNEIAELLITAGADVNANSDDDGTPLDWAIKYNHTKTADLLRKHGGKTGEELKAEGK